MQTTANTRTACCTSDCCGGEATKPDVGHRTINVEFLYLDLSSCDRCHGTDLRLDEAVADVEKVLKAAGAEITVRKIHVTSEQQAKDLAFVSSPTVRVMGRDVQLGGKESACGDCGELAGGCDVDCRVWTWRGQDYTVPPKELLVDAVLRAVYANPQGEAMGPAPLKELPENLRRFFDRRR